MVRWAILHVPLRNLIAGMHNLGHTLNAKETNSFAYLCSIILCLPRVEGARRAARFQLPSPSLSSRQETRVAAALLRRRRHRVLSLSALGFKADPWVETE